MNKGNIISKGKYNYPRDERLAYVTDYLIIREFGKKYLVLRFFNPRKETLNSLRFKLEQLNSEGKTISSKYVVLDRLHGGEEGVFVPENKIAIANDCVDFKVTVAEVGYGSYNYSIVGGDVRVEYVAANDNPANISAIKSKTGGKNLLVKHRKLGFSILICLCSVILIAGITLFTCLQVARFKDKENSFTMGKVEYTFIDGDKSENGTLAVTGYNGKDAELVIPAEIEGYSVTEISSYAFMGNNAVERVIFNDTVKIGDYAFANCDNLTYVDFSNVKSIGQYSFENCTALISIESPIITDIGQYAFSHCTSLQEVLLTKGSSSANSIVSIGESAFAYCSGLNTINIEKAINYVGKNCNIFRECTNVNYLKLKNLGKFKYQTPEFGQLFNTSVSELNIKEIVLEECGEITEGMFQGLTKLSDFSVYNWGSSYIADYAFDGCSALNNLRLGKPITGVGAYAFSNSGITSFDFSSLTEMGESAFKNCVNLYSVTTLEYSPLLAIPVNAFSGCSKLGGLTVPISVETIGQSAFAGCESLREIIFPSKCKLKTIESNAFYNCTSLERIALPSTITKIGTYAFLNCTAAESLTIPSVSVIEEGAFKNCASVGMVSIPSGVTEIGSYAFAECKQLKSVSFPNSLSGIGEWSFSGCERVTEITVPDSVTNIGYAAFRNCNSLTSYTAPYVGGSATSSDAAFLQYVFGGVKNSNSSVPQSLSTVTLTSGADVSDYAFSACSNLTQINLPDIITNIGGYAFADCTSLEQLNLPDQLSVVGDYAFSNCKNLMQLDFPYGLTQIGEYALADCVLLKQITIPDNVEIMGFGLFRGCESLQSLTIPFVGYTTAHHNYIGYNFGYYSEVSNVLPQSLRSITVTRATNLADNAFIGNSNLTAIKLPDSLTGVGSYAFQGCSSLTQLTIPDRVTIMGFGAFEGCTGLTSLTVPFVGNMDSSENYLAYNFGYIDIYTSDYLPQSLKSITITKATSIGENAFLGNKHLAHVSLPDSVTSIGASAFSGCIRLTNINLPRNLNSIGDLAFSGCIRLYEVKNDSSLSIVRGSENNGCVAQYAIEVRSFYDDAAQHATVDGYELAELGGNWYLVAYPYGNDTLSLPKSLNVDGTAVGGYSLAPRLFFEDKTLTKITLPAIVNGIGVSTFEQCTKLSEISINESCGITILPEKSFHYCMSLKRITIPNQVYEIGEDAFTNCFNLREVFNKSQYITIEKGSKGNGGVARWAIAIYSPSNQVSRVSYFTVDGINFADYVGEYIVVGCDPTLTEIDLTNVWYDDQRISSYSVAPGAFYANTSLTSVNFGRGVTSIGECAFTYCDGLSSIIFGGTNLRDIGSYAFGYCKELENIVLTEGLINIDDCAFYECDGLLSVTLPSTLENIGVQAFYGCEELLEVYNASSLGLVKGSTTYGNVAQYAILIYDTASAQSLIAQKDDFMFAYIEDEWVLFRIKNSAVFEGGLCTLPESFTYYGREISSYRIAAGAFDRTGVSNMVIPTSVTAIENSAFYINNVYYLGTQAQWSSITGGNSYKFSSDVLYYDTCVHQAHRWTYNGQGEIISNTQNHFVLGVEASCISEGQGWLICDWCGEILNITRYQKTLHNLDQHGVCTVCGESGTIFTEENIEELGLIVNNATYPYVLGDDGVFSSVNTISGSSSTLKLVADRKMQVAISFSGTGNANDYLTIKYKGSPYRYSGESFEGERLFYLNASDTLEITFTCGSGTAAERGVDIKLKLYFFVEESA